MPKFYSASTGWFYDEALHGARPMTAHNTSEDEAIVQIDNPNCRLPDDAIPITDEHWQTLLHAQSQGKTIQPDTNGRPVAVIAVQTDTQIKTATNVRLRHEMGALETKQPRMLREVALGVPGALDRLTLLDEQITVLRNQIT